MRAYKQVLGGVLLALVVAGCMSSDNDERRAAALGEEEAASLSWRGDWNAEAEYREGDVVTHEGTTFVAVTPTTQTPDARCSGDCMWNVMADTAETINTQPPPPPPPPKIEVFEHTDGYDGPVELPPADQQAVNDWLAAIAPHRIRHRDENGTILGEKLMEQGGNYLVFARGVFASAPGLGKAPIPQGSVPSLGSVVTSGLFSGIGKAIGTPLTSVAGKLLAALTGSGVAEYAISCTLRANRQPIDTASVSITERGTASTSLMGFMISPADVKFDVGCAHNGEKAGPFVRDLRLVVVKFP
jgi:hypothetical protein